MHDVKNNRFKRKLRIVTEPSQNHIVNSHRQPPYHTQQTLTKTFTKPSQGNSLKANRQSTLPPNQHQLEYLENYPIDKEQQMKDEAKMIKRHARILTQQRNKDSSSRKELHLRPNNRYGDKILPHNLSQSGSKERNYFKPRSSNRYEEIYKVYISNRSLSKGNKIARSAMNEGRSSRGDSRLGQGNKKDKIKEIQLSFMKLRNKMEQIDAEEKTRNENVERRQLKYKNKNAATNIIARALKKRKRQRLLWAFDMLVYLQL